MRILDIATTGGIRLHVVHQLTNEPTNQSSRDARQPTGSDTTADGVRSAERTEPGEVGPGEVVEIYDARSSSQPDGESFVKSFPIADVETGMNDLARLGPEWRIDPDTTHVVRRWLDEWLGEGIALVGYQPEHTLLAGISGDLMTTDIADVRAGDLIFRGGHLVRRVLRTPTRRRTPVPGQDEYEDEYRYPVVRLTSPDNIAWGDEFLTPAGTSVLILRPHRPTTTQATRTTGSAAGEGRPDDGDPHASSAAGSSAAGSRMAIYVDESMHTARGYVPAVVIENEPGYSPLTGRGELARPWYWGHDLDVARRFADAANADLGLSPEQARRIVASSIAASLAADSRAQSLQDWWERIKAGLPADPADAPG